MLPRPRNDSTHVFACLVRRAARFRASVSDGSVVHPVEEFADPWPAKLLDRHSAIPGFPLHKSRSILGLGAWSSIAGALVFLYGGIKRSRHRWAPTPPALPQCQVLTCGGVLAPCGLSHLVRGASQKDVSTTTHNGYILRIIGRNQTPRRLSNRPMPTAAKYSVPQRVEPRTRCLLRMPSMLRGGVAPTDASEVRRPRLTSVRPERAKSSMRRFGSAGYRKDIRYIGR